MKITELESTDEDLEFWSTHTALEFMDRGEQVEIDASRTGETETRQAKTLAHLQEGLQGGEQGN